MFEANRVTDLVTGNREQWTWPTIELQKYLQETERIREQIGFQLETSAL